MGSQLIPAPLTRTLAKDQTPPMPELINSIPGRPWTEEELPDERPDKYRHSRLWLSEDQVEDVVVAFRKGGTVHVYRIALARVDGLVSLPANYLRSDQGTMDFHLALGFAPIGHFTDRDDGTSS